METAGHSNLLMEFFLTHNEETWWLMFFWLNRRRISNASKDLGSLWNSGTDVEFPLLGCSWVYASASAPLCSFAFFPLCTASLHFIFILIPTILSLPLSSHQFFWLMTTPKLPLNFPLENTTLSFCHNPQNHIPLVQLALWVSESCSGSRWFAHPKLKLSSLIVHII